MRSEIFFNTAKIPTHWKKIKKLYRKEKTIYDLPCGSILLDNRKLVESHEGETDPNFIVSCSENKKVGRDG